MLELLADEPGVLAARPPADDLPAVGLGVRAGFHDPRAAEPARDYHPVDSEAAREEDAFDIDLEKELMGELDFDETIDKMLASARKFDASKVKNEDISKMGGGPVEAEEA